MNLQEFTSLVLPKVESTIKEVVDQNIAVHVPELREIFYYHLVLGASQQLKGKRIRPLLLLLTCNACGGQWEKALLAAAAVELLHNFSLIHDDVEDHSEIRRGQPSVWMRWGLSQAINSGDAMFATVFKTILTQTKNFDSEITLKAGDILANTCLRLVEGQFLDIANQGKNSIMIDEYWSMIGGKTAALIGCCARVGAVLAGVSSQQEEYLYQFGYHLGLLFQVQDDLLGIWGDENMMGKSHQSDLIQKKMTLPVLYGLELSPRFARRWSQGSIDPKETAILTKWLLEDGVLERVKEDMERINQQIEKNLALSKCPNKEGLNLLRELFIAIKQRQR